jgi:N-acetyl-1-D-myo-inositol-2-amino-2-deoxy-alpha-D-glucopyranoside deacetylase
MNVLFVHAHPDDESINTASTIGHFINNKDNVTVIHFFNGDGGDSFIENLKGKKLAKIRKQELNNAIDILGVNDHRWLEYWSDLYSNIEPINAINKLAEVILELKPNIVITYDEDGGSGHKDHIQVHNIVKNAINVSKYSGHLVAETWLIALPKELNTDDQYFIKNYDKVDIMINGNKFFNQKINAMLSHKSQIKIENNFYYLPDKVKKPLLANEYYVRLINEY